MVVVGMAAFYFHRQDEQRVERVAACMNACHTEFQVALDDSTKIKESEGEFKICLAGCQAKN
jgi:hypothetical protein